MKKHIIEYIKNSKQKGEKLIAVLLDPDKISIDELLANIIAINKTEVSFIFVGGSTVPQKATDTLVKNLKRKTSLPIVLFPGHFDQITPHADGVLFLSLLSGRNPEYLINQQVKAVPYIENTELEVIPTAYILIDGGKKLPYKK